MKKGQVQGQVFIYLLTLIITGMILLFGYNAITDLSKKAEQVEFIQFKNDLKQDFETMSSNYGDADTITYNAPSKVKEICFYQGGEDVNFSLPDDLNPLIKGELEDKTGNNAFLVMGNGIPDPMKLSRIEINNSNYDILCIEINNNRLKLRLESLGDGVFVEPS
jgi:hypothetical protein